MQKILVIQTAFTGDVVLATSVVEKLHQYFPSVQIDFLLRKGKVSKKPISISPGFDTSMIKFGKAYMEYSYQDYLNR